MTIFTAQPAQLVRYGLLAYGSQPFAPELRRHHPAFEHPSVKEARADLEFSGHFRHGFSQSDKFDGLGLEFCGVSFSGH